jgi:hypothetical protein
MAGEPISFEELFEQQNAASTALRFAAQQIPDDSEHVKVTPVDADGNCWCSSAIVIPVASVASLRSTDGMTVCCGKRLRVVEIEFADTALAAVIGQVHARAAAAPVPGYPSGQSLPNPFNQLGIPPAVPSPGASRLATAPLFEQIMKSKTLGAWPDIGCLARWWACLIVCGGYEGCAEICYRDYVACSGG